jgi:hypothetical protein
MSFILLGILNSQAAGAVGAGDYDLLETTVLGSDTASVEFTSLNSTYGSTYKHLQIRYASRSTRTSDNLDSVAIQLNADTGANYARHGLFGQGSSVSSQASTSASRMDIGWQSTNNQTANIFGGGVIDILDSFDTGKNTTLRSLSGATGASSIIILNSGVYINTAATTSIKLFPGFSGLSFVTGSRFSLYGIRAA